MQEPQAVVPLPADRPTLAESAPTIALHPASGEAWALLLEPPQDLVLAREQERVLVPVQQELPALQGAQPARQAQGLALAQPPPQEREQALP